MHDCKITVFIIMLIFVLNCMIAIQLDKTHLFTYLLLIIELLNYGLVFKDDYIEIKRNISNHLLQKGLRFL